MKADPDVRFFPPINFVIIYHMLAGKALMIDVKKKKSKKTGWVPVARCRLPVASYRFLKGKIAVNNTLY